MKQVLLLGGPADGKRVEVIDELATIHLYQYPAYMVQFFDETLDRDDLVYHIHKLAGLETIFWLGTFDDMPVDEALERLIDGYPRTNC